MTIDCSTQWSAIHSKLGFLRDSSVNEAIHAVVKSVPYAFIHISQDILPVVTQSRVRNKEISSDFLLHGKVIPDRAFRWIVQLNHLFSLLISVLTFNIADVPLFLKLSTFQFSKFFPLLECLILFWSSWIVYPLPPSASMLISGLVPPCYGVIYTK